MLSLRFPPKALSLIASRPLLASVAVPGHRQYSGSTVTLARKSDGLPAFKRGLTLETALVTSPRWSPSKRAPSATTATTTPFSVSSVAATAAASSLTATATATAAGAKSSKAKTTKTASAAKLASKTKAKQRLPSKISSGLEDELDDAAEADGEEVDLDASDIPADAKEARWTTFVHNGPLFPEPYTRLPVNVTFFYDGQPVRMLPDVVEEAVCLFAARLNSPLIVNPKFRLNFIADLNKLVDQHRHELASPLPKVLEYDKCDFTKIAAHLMRLREKKRSALTAKEKAKKAERALKHGVVVVDGVPQKFGPYVMEPPSIFLGRGNSPLTGHIKPRLSPADVTLNLSEGAPVPPSPVPGTNWKAIVSRPTALWSATWTCKISGLTKAIVPSRSAKLIQEATAAKFDQVRKLGEHISEIREQVFKCMRLAKEPTVQAQTALGVYLLDQLALRPGTSKIDTDSSYGLFTLLPKHVKLVEPRTISFDFPGKDMVQYTNSVEVDPSAFKVFKMMMAAAKDPKTPVFDSSVGTRVDTFVKSFDKNFSARSFRTYSASSLFERSLPDCRKVSEVHKKAAFDRANVAVARLCNHQRITTTNPADDRKKMASAMKAAKASLTKIKDELKETPKTTKKYSALVERKKKAEDRIVQLEVKQETKEDSRALSLNTSKVNYIDPRISVAWCKRNKLDLNKIFPPTTLDRFSWALDTKDDFVFSTAPAPPRPDDKK
ncbi:hypothetical protein CAOG_04887 [Capsaspora owczarzaki ATCC 30864]|uniref:DNA topoisomerase 1 n=1 Tax=Capsaspora owczarzaki (strain ATCC 30864) TaxID=595528 RepID=A0A0D2X3F3_CAPO3|nr:hypothetical protein CAOG_04887 [Capsaspora owczarzaki ATCC 30864]KJE94209.1 hypothetical protein CAOG_004887 [Capsaspora owczarzaki ATCC 30864]|eukprot:XP_004347638.2 hypothetical protein CAOG_04887 [Capsaspora owczarzaki ATCC 30864]